MTLSLSNPHSVLAALRQRPQDVTAIQLRSTRPGDAWQEVIRQAERNQVPVVSESGGRGDARGKGRRDTGGRSGGCSATVREKQPVSLAELLRPAQRLTQEQASNRTATPMALWLALDRIQDPHNVGAIFRTAAFFGVHGLLLTRDHSAPLSATVYDTASGGVEFVPFSLETNLVRALQQAKSAGLWVLGTSEHSALNVSQVDRNRPWLLVLGNEEKGLKRLTLENCDEVCRLAPRGGIRSLNVSVAAGALIAILNCDHLAQPKP